MELVNLSISQNQTRINKTLLEEEILMQNGKIPRVSQTPFFMLLEHYEKVAALGELLSSALEKFLRLYVDSTEVQALFPELEELRELSCIRPDSKYWIHMSRFDTIYTPDGQFKILETNSSAPQFLTKTFVKKLCREISKPVFPDGTEEVEQPIDSIIYFPMSLLALSKEVVGKDKPNVLLLTSPNSKRVPADIGLMERVLKYIGLSCARTTIAELQNLDKIYANNIPIDVAYQKIPLRLNARNQVNFCSGEFSETQGTMFFEALQNQKIGLANNFVAFLVAENKRILALVKRAEFHKYFTEAEQEAIMQFIPETYCFDQTNQHDFPGLSADFLKNPSEWVIKSSYGKSGLNVWMGKETLPHIWKDLVQKLRDQPYIIQRHIESEPSDVLTCDEPPQIHQMFSTVSLHIIRGKPCGLYCRSSETFISNIPTGGCQRVSYILCKK